MRGRARARPDEPRQDIITGRMLASMRGRARARPDSGNYHALAGTVEASMRGRARARPDTVSTTRSYAPIRLQ